MNASLVRLLIEIAGAIAGSALGAGALAIAVRSLDARALPWAVPPTARAEAPYDGRRAGVLVGAAGEWIELVETP
jgi:hypothetical protein